MSFTQANRAARFYTAGLPDDTLLLLNMDAREGISSLYEYNLVALSDDENIAALDLLGQTGRVELDLSDGGLRLFSGHITRFVFTGYHGGLARYELRLSPWLWFLTRSADVRIHQNAVYQDKTVVDIVRDVCQEHGFTDIDLRLQHDYEPLSFCVQYRESGFAFVSRLMESAGIYYFFDHDAAGSRLVLADDTVSHAPLAGDPELVWRPSTHTAGNEEEYLSEWRMGREVRTGAVRLRAYDFENPTANLDVDEQAPQGGEHDGFERYDYPGSYRDRPSGEAMARLRLESFQADIEVLHGQGNVRGLVPGYLFELTEHYRADQNREYLILTVKHEIRLADYDSSDPGEFKHHCALSAIPSDRAYRPPLVTPRPIVHGPHTARVVGEPGEVIHTDEHRRIQVQFHWDREGQRNQNSSCWLRLAQNWAGSQHGNQFLPRVGDEVIVEFLEGDPDQPVVTGSLYNGSAKTSFEPRTQTGIRTHFLNHGTTSDNFSELRFEDESERAEVSLRTGGGIRMTSLLDRPKTMQEEFDEKGTFKDNTDKENALKTIGKALQDDPVKQDHGHINILATEKITLSAPKVYINEFKKIDCGKTGNTVYHFYNSEYRESYKAQYGGIYSVIYGYTPELAAAVETCTDLPIGGNYEATYNMHYEATYQEPYQATYNQSYTAHYNNPYSVTYNANVSVRSERDYEANYNKYTAHYSAYDGTYGLASGKYGAYFGAKAMSLELKGISLGLAVFKMEEAIIKLELDILNFGKKKLKFENNELKIDTVMGPVVQWAAFKMEG